MSDLIQLATQGWGWVADERGNALPNEPVQLEHPAGGSVDVFEDALGTTPLSGLLMTDTVGMLRGYAAPGRYELTVGGVTRSVEATTAQDNADLDAHAARLNTIESNGGPAKLGADNAHTGRLTITRDLENLKLVPATVEGRMQIQWRDLSAHGGRSGPADVVSMDVHGDPHWHWEIYTYSPSADTLVKRIAINYDEDAPFVTMHGGGLFLEGKSTAEDAAGGDPILRFGGTKATSQEIDLVAVDNELRWIDHEGGDVERMSLDMDTGKLSIAGSGKDAIQLPATASDVGITFGGDVTLYRTAGAAVLKTDNQLQVGGNFRHFGAALSFYGGASTTKQTVTGSRAGNAALASLLTALAAVGLVTNSSTA